MFTALALSFFVTLSSTGSILSAEGFQSIPSSSVISSARTRIHKKTPHPRTCNLPPLHHAASSLTTTPIAVSDELKSFDKDTESSPEKKSQEEFDWFKSWYPLVPVEFVDTSKPHKFTLLGMDLVIWNDHAESDTFGPKTKKKNSGIKKLFGGKSGKEEKKTNGQWRAFVDKCPHRLVPLSEGRVESDGSLLCSYHGWRFNGDGGCIAIPQTDEHQSEAQIANNPKANCNSFPVKVINDVLWVWPSSDSNAVLESELTPVPVMPPLKDTDGSVIDDDRIVYNHYNFRELPYGADYFLENVVDPAHVPVSHHNVVGNRYTGPQPLKIMSEEPMTKKGFVSRVMNQDGTYSRQEYKAPCLVSIDDCNPDARSVLELYTSPSKPGFSNHVGRLVLVKDEKGIMPKAFKQFTLPIPIWANHLLAATFLNQDALFLHAQERNLHHDLNFKTAISADDMVTATNNPNYKEMVYTPTNSDRGVVLFRDWLRLKAGGRIPFRGYNGMPTVDNEIVFDQWHSHTKNCKYCMDAHKNAKKVRLTSAMIAIAIALLQPGGKVTRAMSVGLFGGISFASHKIIGAFHRVEFSHAEND